MIVAVKPRQVVEVGGQLIPILSSTYNSSFMLPSDEMSIEVLNLPTYASKIAQNANVKVYQGYIDEYVPVDRIDKNKLTLVFEGRVRSRAYKGNENGQIISFTALDYFDALIRATPITEEYENKTASEIVTDIAQRVGLGTSRIKATSRRYENRRYDNQLPADIISDLANAEGFERYVDHKRNLVFQPADANQTEVYTFEWGKNIISYEVEELKERVYTKVRVTSWNEETAEEIVGEATAGQEWLDNYGVVLYEVDDPGIKTQVEAEAKAQALLKKQLIKNYQVRLETVGVPDIRKGDLVVVKGIPYAGRYYVSELTLRYGDSYTMSLSCTSQKPTGGV